MLYDVPCLQDKKNNFLTKEYLIHYTFVPMVYYAIGTMSGSSMDGLDIVYCKFEEVGGRWAYHILNADCIEFSNEWKQKLQNITGISAKDLLLTHTAFGHWMGHAINDFISKNTLEHKVHLIGSHGHTVFHEPALGMTFQMGDGASIAAITRLPVVSDLRNMDVALGGQGAPIVPIGEKLLWNDFAYFLNIGGISNITIYQNGEHFAFDVCPANRVLNLLSNELGKSYDDKGLSASEGKVNEDLLFELNDLEYYKKSFPKSLANEYGADVLFGIIQKYTISTEDKLCTVCEHIAFQIGAVCEADSSGGMRKMLISGGGALNEYLISRIRHYVSSKQIEVVIPDADLIQYKEALIMALIAVLRWREEVNVLSSVSGSARNSIGGALWMGQD